MGAATIGGGSLLASSGVDLDRRISGFGTVGGPFSGRTGSVISVTGGNLVLGDASDIFGFSTAGSLQIGGGTATLLSAAFAPLGTLTTLNGGTLVAANGVVIGPGGHLSGSGSVTAAIAAVIGSTIEAGGNLTLGSASAFDGFYSDLERIRHGESRLRESRTRARRRESWIR